MSADLGLGAGLQTPTKKGKRKAPSPEASQPTRRSLREDRKLTAKGAALAAGEEPAIEEVDPELERERALHGAHTATVVRKRGKVTAEEAADALDTHNRNRIASMSDAQLRTRISRITNLEKLRSFIVALDQSGLGELADEARHRLGKLVEGVESGNEDEDV